MKKPLVVLGLVIFTLPLASFAADWNCTVKTLGLGPSGGAKLSFALTPRAFSDETDVLNVTDPLAVTVGADTLAVSGGTAYDDECEGACRKVLSVKVNADSPTIGYANGVTKLGVIHPSYKVSCAE